MLSEPDVGWSDFSLGDWSYPLSHLTDLPFDWVDQCIYGLKKLEPFTVWGTCEGARVLCTVSYYNCHIVYEDSSDNDVLDRAETEWHIEHISMIDFCKMLHADISNSIDVWITDWYSACEEEKQIELKQELGLKLEELGKLIGENEENFRSCHFW